MREVRYFISINVRPEVVAYLFEEEFGESKVKIIEQTETHTQLILTGIHSEDDIHGLLKDIFDGTAESDQFIKDKPENLTTDFVEYYSLSQPDFGVYTMEYQLFKRTTSYLEDFTEETIFKRMTIYLNEDGPYKLLPTKEKEYLKSDNKEFMMFKQLMFMK